MIRSARARGDRPRRSARPCSVTTTCTSCSVWSTWLTIGTIVEIAPPFAADAVHHRAAHHVGRVHVAVDVGLDHPVHRDDAEPAHDLGVVRDLLAAHED